MRIDKSKLKSIAEPLPETTRRSMQQRKADRYMNAASATIAAKVLRQMRIIGMTRVQLAEKLNITPANITRYLNGKCNFELRTLVEMERVLHINIIDRNIIPKSEIASHVILIVHNHASQQDEYISSPSDAISYIEHA